MRDQGAGQWCRRPAEARPRLTRSGSREAATLTRSGSRKAATLTRLGSRLPVSAPVGYHAQAPALRGAVELLPWLSVTDEFASPPYSAAELELPASAVRGTVLSRIAPLLTAGLLGVVVALLLVIAVAPPR